MEEEGGRRCECRDVAGPAEPLVALRAVGRHVDEVAALAPDHVAVELVEHLVRALEVPDPVQLGVHDHCAESVSVDLARPAVDLGIAEAVERLRRLEDVIATGRGVRVGRLGRSERARAQLLVLEHLSVTDRDRRACRGVEPHSDPADEVLAEVDYRPAAGGGPDLLRRDLLVPDDARARVRYEPGLVEVPDRDTGPAVAWRDAAVPAGDVDAGVDGLPVVQIVRGRLRRTRLPGLI